MNHVTGQRTSQRPWKETWFRAGCRPTGSYPETGFAELWARHSAGRINGDLLEADFSGLIPLYLCSGVQCDSGLRGFVPSGLDRTQHSVFARARSSISGIPAQAIILKCDCNAEYTHQDPASGGLPPILYSMACHRRGASLVACRADPCGRAVDRPTDNRGAHPAPLAGLDSPHAVSRTLQIHSAQPNLARSPARCNRRRGRALLPAPWVRLARDPNRCRRRFGRRSHSRSFHHYAATRKKPILRNGPLYPPQGRGGHTGTGGRIRPRQTAHSGDIPQRGRMGPWYLWCRVGVSLLRRNRSPEYRPATGGTARCNSAGPPEATTRAHE